jgi:hypothetical protein
MILNILFRCVGKKDSGFHFGTKILSSFISRPMRVSTTIPEDGNPSENTPVLQPSQLRSEHKRDSAPPVDITTVSVKALQVLFFLFLLCFERKFSLFLQCIHSSLFSNVVVWFDSKNTLPLLNLKIELKKQIKG